MKNFHALIKDLKQSGLTQSQVADRIGIRQSSISCLFTGKRKDTSWSIGDALLRLHREVCGEAAHAALLAEAKAPQETTP